MTTATIGIEDVSAEIDQEHIAQLASDPLAREQSMNEARSDKHGHDEWTQRLDEAWQGHLDTLQQCVCELLHKNQQLRMALAANGQGQQREHFGRR